MQYLEENKQLIMAILENQNKGNVSECASWVANYLQCHLTCLFPFWHKNGVICLILNSNIFAGSLMFLTISNIQCKPDPPPHFLPAHVNPFNLLLCWWDGKAVHDITDHWLASVVFHLSLITFSGLLFFYMALETKTAYITECIIPTES